MKRRAIEQGTVVLALAIGLAALPACSAAPRQRPVKMGDVETGTGSLESTRRQFEGTWDLVSFETYPESGKKVTQQATAVLTYDAYGNMEINGRLTQPGQTAAQAASLLTYKGKVVIDVEKRQLRVVNPQGDQKQLPAEASTALARQYSFANDMLTLSMVDTAGRPTASATWKKRPQ
jgi:hypothetical protein